LSSLVIKNGTKLITVGINVRKKKKLCPTFCYLIPGGKTLKASNQIDTFPASSDQNPVDLRNPCQLAEPGQAD
jgi:hypothetical protein